MADVDVARQPVRLHPGGSVDRVPEETVARHLHANNAGHHRSSVHPHTNLEARRAMTSEWQRDRHLAARCDVRV